MNRRNGLLKVADLAGVSLSTVDRVLNERGSVSDLKRRKVINAARSLGLKRLLPSPVHGLLRFDLLLVESDTDHYRRLATAFATQAQLLRSRLVLQRQTWCASTPEQLVEFINTPRSPRQGLIVVAYDAPAIRMALEAQIALGVPVVLLTSSLSGIEGATYIGIDNRAAGRCAGRLLSQWAGRIDERVLLVTNSLLFHAHQERVKGFLDVLAERSSTLVVGDIVECHDEDVRTFEAVVDVVSKGISLGAIYNTGAGSEGIQRALKEWGIKPVWITHEASAQHARLLRDGLLSLVIDQDPEGQAEAAIQHLLVANGDLEAATSTGPQLRIVIDESLPVSGRMETD